MLRLFGIVFLMKCIAIYYTVIVCINDSAKYIENLIVFFGFFWPYFLGYKFLLKIRYSNCLALWSQETLFDCSFIIILHWYAFYLVSINIRFIMNWFVKRCIRFIFTFLFLFIVINWSSLICITFGFT